MKTKKTIEFQNMSKEYIKIVLIEDDPTIRDAYVFLINERDGYKIVNSYSSAEAAVRKLLRDEPDLILLDIGLPGMSGLDAIIKIKNIIPDVPILILTVHESEDFIFRALTEGASGYLTKNCSAEKIIYSIIEVMKGGGSMSANVAKIVFNSFHKSDTSPLSKRETEILEKIANGNTRGRIADSFFISDETVKSHIKNIYRKLKVHSRADAIKSARENKFI